MVRCQDCEHCYKVGYRQARNVHHTNWERDCGEGPCNYEMTIAERDCDKFNFKPGQK